MGINNLNKFLLEKCNKSSIYKIHLSELSGKIIAVDTSIYLYKFMADNTLLEHFYLMISLFRHYNIVPLFVLDGKPPKEKRELLWKRKKHKKASEEQYNKLNEQYNTLTNNSEEKMKLKKEMDLLKREMTTISGCDLETIKSLINAYGAKYLQAEGEADVLCVQLVNSNKAWGCMSDDMDMFVYGCARVYRHFSLVNHSVIYYDLTKILQTLKMNIETFRTIVVLCGTDYNCNHKTTIGEMNELYEKYKQNEHAFSLDHNLTQNPKYNDIDLETLSSTLKLFDTYNYTENNYILENIDQQIHFDEININALIDILEKDGFVFIQ